MTSSYRVSVVGGSGYAGGELIRLIDGHPALELVQATSRSHHRSSVGRVHPNLRGLGMRFSDPSELEPVDLLFAATPHGVTMNRIEDYLAVADRLVDLSADFRLPTLAWYDRWYDGHEAPSYLDAATYGLPELSREDTETASIIACGGCNATAVLLGLLPLANAGILDRSDAIVADLKVGSSEGGRREGVAASHPERTGVIRPYAPAGHRHEAELAAHLDVDASMTVHAVEATRGVAATCHVVIDDTPTVRQLWDWYRSAFEEEPFVRLVANAAGNYRYPEPKVLVGTNFADVGFAVEDGRIVVFSAIDNLMKGAAGQAVHAANVALGLEETAGLTFQGLHPVGAA